MLNSRQQQAKLKKQLEGELYHLSFKPTLNGRWKPRQPHGSNTSEEAKTKLTYENLPPRISVSPTIQQCFWAIYPNISQFFEVKRYPYIVMYVYRPKITYRTKVIGNNEVKRHVHDAHITGEICIISSVIMEKIAKIKIYNPVKNPEVKYRMFNLPDKPETFLSHRMYWERLENFIPNKLPSKGIPITARG